MKKTLTLASAIILAAVSLSAANNSKLYNQAISYFRSALKGQQTTMPKLGKATSADSLTIWQAWQQAVMEQTETKLGAPANLNAADGRVWDIPDSLEPNAKLNYYYATKGDKPQAGYPLFMYFHGSGARADEWASGLKFAQIFDDAPSLYFIPQIPQEGQWYRWYQVSKQWFIEKAIREALVQGDIDPRRIYFFGISEGGYGSQRLASFYADYLAAAGPMAGGEPLKNAPAENLSNTAFSLLTGERDLGFYRNELTMGTRKALDSLQTLYPNQFTHKVELIPGMGHGIDYRVTTPWLSKHIRNPYPSHFIWEDYEMHGRHRNGFYNLRVDQRPSADPDKRTRYDVNINGNTIDITVQDITYTCTRKDPNWGIELFFAREYAPSTSGKLTLFLNNQLVDLKKPVIVNINGKVAFQGKVAISQASMLRSLETFGDPLRIFPASVQLEVK